MGKIRSYRFSALLLVAIVALALLAFPGCSKVKDKAAGAAESALGAVEKGIEKGAEIAGEATANWLGTTAGNVGKNFNETIAERFAYLEITVDSVDRIPLAAVDVDEGDDEDEAGETDEGVEGAEGVTGYYLDLTINNTAPDTEKMYYNVLLDDYYLVACDQDDYTYSLSADGAAKGYYDPILPGKSKLSVYTEISEPDEISYLLFIGDKIKLP